MADPFDALLAGEDSPEARAQALAAALRRRQAVGTLGMLSGDKVLSQYGRQAMQGADELALQRAELQRQAQAIQKERTDAYNRSVDASISGRQQGYDLQREKLADAQEARRAKASLAAHVSARKEAERARAASEKAEGLEVPFYGGALKPTKAPRAYRDADVGKVRADAGLYTAALGGMDDLEESVRRYVAAPGMQTKNDVQSRVVTVATALNAALGQGAMSEQERRGIESALGANLGSIEGVSGAIASLMGANPDEAGRALLSRVRAVRDVTAKTGRQRFKSFNFEFEPAQKAPVGGAAPKAKAKDESAALKWAKANPDDPRAAAILKRLGVD